MDWQKNFDLIDRELEDLFNSLDGKAENVLQTPPAAGKWSALQTLEHLYLAESLTLKYIRKKLSYQPSLRKADWRTAFKRFGLWVYTRIPIPFPAPGPVSTSQLPVDSDFSELKDRYRALRTETRTYLLSLSPEIHHSEIYKHPISGRIDIPGVILFFREHFRRHRRQIRKAVRRAAA